MPSCPTTSSLPYGEAVCKAITFLSCECSVDVEADLTEKNVVFMRHGFLKFLVTTLSVQWKLRKETGEISAHFAGAKKIVRSHGIA